MKNTYLLSLCLFFITLLIYSQEPFITTWEVSEDDLSIIIDTSTSSYTYNYTIDFGDGTISNNVQGNISHTYASSGTYIVQISGDFPSLKQNENDLNNTLKLMSVQQWGDIEWQTMKNMFYNCVNLVVNATDVPDLSQVTDMSNMFYGCNSFNHFINTWDVSNVTNMAGMFESAYSFNQSLDDWDVSSVSNMSNMFSGCNSFNQPLNTWDVSSVTTMDNMFGWAYSFNQPLDSWDVSSVTDMSNMFDGASSFNQSLDAWDVSNVTDMSNMFKGAYSFNQSIDSWDVSSVTNMDEMFFEATSFNQSIDNWDVSNVSNMDEMFRGASSFNQPLDSWDVSSVSHMSNMFNEASSFNQPLNSWDVSNATNIQGMFSGAISFNQPLDAWDVSNAISLSSMFYEASSFNQPLDSWDVSNVTLMDYMFDGASSFNKPLDSWDISSVTSMRNMFSGAISFNQPIDNWDVSNVETMLRMFNGASVFNQPLHAWDYSSIGTANGLRYFLDNSGLSTVNYDLLLEHLVTFNLDLTYFDAQGVTYCNEWAHDYLENTLGWIITDGGVSENCNAISGSVWYDIDGDGCETTVIPANGFFVGIDTGTNTYTKSVQNGTYNITTNEESYTVSLVNTPDYFTVSPGSIEVDFATSTGELVDFCITANQSVNDLNITLLPLDDARPGFEATYKLVVENLGTQSIDNITTTLLFDETMQSFVEANPTTSAITTNSLEFNIAMLAPFDSWETDIVMLTFTPPTVNGDDILNFTAEVLPNTNDNTPNDNNFSLAQIVVNSYDPNDKQVLQGETIVMEQASEYLDYLIRFQNTGSASAINVMIEDELHDNLDWSTLNITSASHDYEVEITNGNEVKFIFNGINLPSEDQNEPQSHGFIAYKIKPIATIAVGDIMSGDSSIYFDFNEPIITNMVSTEVVNNLSVDDYSLSSLVSIYPNPVEDGFYFKLDKGMNIISRKLYNTQGIVLLDIEKNTDYITTEELASGVYFMVVETNKGKVTKKLIKK